jgi:predicted dehydrogenase
MILGVGIVGAGRIGARRAEVLSRMPGARLVAVADVDTARAETLARAFGSRAYAEPQAVIGARDVDAVIVATPHQWLAPVAKAALDAGKHVLCEKPLARTPAEAAGLVAAAAQSRCALKTGFNHRYHPAIAEAHRLASEGRIGRLLVLRCRYGHGGRAGYEREWRADRLSGGGELLDQGVHALDLFRWFAGEFTEVTAMLSSAFWPIEVEDNVFCLLRSAEGATASLHASWMQWKNLFSFEVFGDRGYLVVDDEHARDGNYAPIQAGVQHWLLEAAV